MAQRCVICGDGMFRLTEGICKPCLATVERSRDKESNEIPAVLRRPIDTFDVTAPVMESELLWRLVPWVLVGGLLLTLVLVTLTHEC